MSLKLTPLQQILHSLKPRSYEKKALAHFVGLNSAVIHNWRTGRSQPSVKNAHKLVEHFSDKGLTFQGCYIFDPDFTIENND